MLFPLKLIPVLPDGDKVPLYNLTGPCLQLSENECFLLSSAEYQALQEVDKHQKLLPQEKTEHINLFLVGCLQQAKQQGMKIDLAHFNNLNVQQPQTVGVTASEQADGSLVLTPNYGTGSSPDDIHKRLGQLSGNDSVGTIRIRDQIVVLDEERLKATQEILSTGRIPRGQVEEFLKSPSAFLDASLIDLDTGFSIRVKGAARFQFMQFGETDASGIDWFQLGQATEDNYETIKKLVSSPEDLETVKDKIESALKQGAESVVQDGQMIDLSNPEQVRKDLHQVEENLKRPAGLERDSPKNAECRCQ